MLDYMKMGTLNTVFFTLGSLPAGSTFKARYSPDLFAGINGQLPHYMVYFKFVQLLMELRNGSDTPKAYTLIPKS